MKRSRFVLLLALTLVPAIAAGQALQTGDIRGKAQDASGAVLPGVAVTLSSPVLISPKTATTDQQGSYAFQALTPGTYTVTFELAGFRKYVRTGIEVSVGRSLNVDGTMDVGSVSENITVEGTPNVDVTKTNLATNLDADHLQNVPTARDVWSLLQNMAPQVVLDREDVGGSEGGLQAVFATHGSTWHQNTYALNGVNVTDPSATGASGFYFDYDSFQDVQISTAQHPADVGTPGVYFNQVVKSGTDKFHGGSAYYFENGSTVGDNLTQELKNQGVASGSSINLFSDWTAQLGGPLIRDKVRFFTSWRDWRIHRNVVDFPKSENTDLFSWLVNGTYQLNAKNQITGLATRQTYWKPNRNADALIAPEATWIEDDIFRIYQGRYNSSISNNALFDARISYLKIDFPLKFQPDVTGPHTTELSTGFQCCAAAQSYKFYRSRTSAEFSMSYFKNDWLGANHDIKGGYQYFRGYARTGADVLEAVDQNLFNGDGSYIIQYNTPLDSQDTFTGSVLYLQDNVRPADKLTLNLGFRYEHNHGFLPAQSSPAGRFTGPRDFPEQDLIHWNTGAARIGAVYDVFGTHKFAIKGGYARYYHAIGTGFVDVSNQNGFGGTGYSWNDANHDQHYQLGEEVDQLFVFGGSITSVDPNLKQPHTDEGSFGVEFEAPKQIRVSAMFIGRRGRDLIAVTEIGVPQDSTGYAPVTALDPGPDGTAGTSDDKQMTVFNQISTAANKQLETNPSDFTTGFKGLEITVQRRFMNRWQFLTSYSVSKDNLSTAGVGVGAFSGEEEGAGTSSAFLSPNGKINNTSGPSFFDRTHILKMDGSYEVPRWDMNVAAVVKVQSGTPFGRSLTVDKDINGNAFNQGPITIFAEPRDSRRFPTLKTMDFRVSKIVRVQQQRFEVIGDFFNLFNVSTVTNENSNTGPDFGKPTNILGPRAFRIGGRWSF
ncbi:MAG TPA: TonB-dependent receptor [Vicinamibacterales bacterium]|jgi:hypothetical protein|nr:TonB-dependent receptor [Vicinamibacterales bacterium]